MKNQEIKIFSMGCRLNALEAEKIRTMLFAAGMRDAVIINTCAVTHEALRQSRQTFRKIIRDNPTRQIFITGCGATLNPADFAPAIVIPNKEKFNPEAYGISSTVKSRVNKFEKMQKKGFVQISDGCDRLCTYCITRVLRGPANHFPYEQILDDARILVQNGYEEIILTGVNIADWTEQGQRLAGLCKKLLYDIPDMKYLSLSSLDPAADIESIIDLIRNNPRMTRHLHLSVQSGCDAILQKMGRRHTAQQIRSITVPDITFSWDIICGFPGETDEMFNDTLALARELKPIKIHAFPFSARPNTIAQNFPNKITRKVAKERVRQLTVNC